MTKRVLSEGAEEWLGHPIKILDHGFVYLVDYMGDDLAIEESARVSYGPETKRSTDSTGLIRYLMRNKHTSPFEMVELKFHLKMPIFVARQWVRHRTASMNEISGRYSVLPDEFYVPPSENISLQSEINNQGRGESANLTTKNIAKQFFHKDPYNIYSHYYKLVNDLGIAKELARIILPVSVYTEFYWKIDLHNLLHFLQLRMDEHAQLEIREYANAIAAIVEDGWPIAYNAFNDYVRNSETFSAEELRILGAMIDGGSVEDLSELGAIIADKSGLSKREAKEFELKLKRMMK